ncbi:hypothetical protein EXIGLDRAFT_774731 [Exidia glandulosa HHB12029]|uniref:F-box domain-containing protein n=1 Tax=Exidia glandulosa HHB12029 TaxID=1314781 RepID=A0A165E8R8_EXIGL|nr:hypothetical protein EXIGLDRAFT_774731 [Exidia glandulosa HHB12029]
MGKRTPQPITATPARRLTRQRLRAVLSGEFTQLPLEIVRQIVTNAAQDNIADSPLWVAQSLALVCREFQNAVEPILVDTVRLTRRNTLSMKSQFDGDRFARTRHFIALDIDNCLFPPSKCLVSFTGQISTLHRLVNPALGNCRPTRFTLCAAFNRVQDSFDCITHLHIQHGLLSYHEEIQTAPFPRLTHVVVTLNQIYEHSAFFDEIATDVPLLLASSPTIQRLLFRTLQLLRTHSDNVAAVLQRLADTTRDERLWLDERSFGQDRLRLLVDHLVWEEANAQDDIWYTGRQLYHPQDSIS